MARTNAKSQTWLAQFGSGEGRSNKAAFTSEAPKLR
jgi:hypothetical protein